MASSPWSCLPQNTAPLPTSFQLVPIQRREGCGGILTPGQRGATAALAGSSPPLSFCHPSQLVQLEIPDKPEHWSELVWQLCGNSPQNWQRELAILQKGGGGGGGAVGKNCKGREEWLKYLKHSKIPLASTSLKLGVETRLPPPHTSFSHSVSSPLQCPFLLQCNLFCNPIVEAI